MKEKPKGEIVIYQAKGGKTTIEVKLQEETVWLNLIQMTELFHRDKSVISRHISNIFKEGELEKKLTVANFATVQTEGSRSVERSIEFYNLDVIISVGYRVKSKRGTQFRICKRGTLLKTFTYSHPVPHPGRAGRGGIFKCRIN